ncbi:splicing factor 1 isoform X2 [Impatiens glandulifera]|nr:splicing factor 1 isoform X2 [Impatiens glandulifera]
MNTKVQHSSSAEQAIISPGVTANLSTMASTSSPKVSLFAKKLGFVIPKNKLSGSLVPIFRDAKKRGSGEVVNGKSKEQAQRNTKWGPDLTQETSVRKARALAYQVRVDQITQQLNSRTLSSDHQHLVEDEAPDHKLPNHQINDENLLELEKRELIGEILKLNPSYKAPHDYKPLLKEAKVPIPSKDYPGYNFIGLFFGSSNDTQKRLEKETGAKIKVYGIKANTGEKAEINASDGNETINSCSEVYVHIAADTYEKVDSAVELIEMLITPISVNSAAAPPQTPPPSVSVDTIKEGISSQIWPSVGANQEHPSPIGSTQIPSPGQFQPYTSSSSPWFSVGPTQSLPPPNFSAPPPPPPSAVNPIQSSFGPRPIIPPAGPGPYPGNFAMGPSRPWQPPRFMPPLNVRPPPPFSQNVPISHSGPTSFPQGPSPSPNFQRPPNLSQNHNLMGGTVNPPPIITAPKPLNPRPSDFTFHPHLPPNPQPGFQHSNVGQPPPPQGRQFQVNYPTMNQPPTEMPRFGGNRHPSFPNSNPSSTIFNIPPPMGPRNFGPSPPVPNLGNRPPFPQQNFPGQPPRNQLFNSDPRFAHVRRPVSVSSGQQQVYDPFSPTAITPQQGKPRSSENNDSEYDDLMASVGVK